MPRRKVSLFMAAITMLLILVIISAVMSLMRYDRTLLVPLVLMESTEGPADIGAAEIERQIREYDGPGEVLWNGPVCEVCYSSLSGAQKVHYLCPYFVAPTDIDLSEENTAVQISLRVACCTVTAGRLTSLSQRCELSQVSFTCKTPGELTLSDASFSSMETVTSAGNMVAYDFADSETVSGTSEVSARVNVRKATDEEMQNRETEGEGKIIVNWSFLLTENDRTVNDFDGVQIEIGYHLTEEGEADD